MQVISFGYVYKGNFTKGFKGIFWHKVKKIKICVDKHFERIILSVCVISIKSERILDMVF